jgi:translation initiation factor IF-1
MRVRCIRILLIDEVAVELAPCDLSRAHIVFRAK